MRDHYRGAISRIDPALRHSVILYANAGCLPILDVTISSREHCRSNNSHALNIIKSYNIKNIVLAGYWEYNLKKNGLSVRDVARSVSKLRAMGLSVRIIGDNPDFPIANPQYLAMRLQQRDLPHADFYVPIRNNQEFNKKLSNVAGEDEFFNPMTSLCRGDECLAYRNGKALMVDNAHLSRYGADIVLRRMRTFLDRPD
ncbi:SGNH hydrolase domain-containing protein [Sphingomonas sp. 22R3R2A-7]|uniref:SGNH hydrolase domain-containing protein n=1 Tax=Sphingomonas sp. 22R3R2A-7 TaxID=3050230 RepID=UPI002FE17761